VSNGRLDDKQRNAGECVRELDFAKVSAGDRHACGVTGGGIVNPPTAAGAVYCWGDNNFGQLGNSWTTTSSVPVNVAGQP
jgi:alpha-tubulin suppressor-like RCC1 family protein